MRPYIVLLGLEQVDGDWDFAMHMATSFCAGAKAQVELCRQAARDCDTAVLQFEAHSLKGGAAVCFAIQLANACATLEHTARLVRGDTFSETTGDSSIAPAPSKSPECWTAMVDDIAECLDELVRDVDALASMRTWPCLDALTDVCGEDVDAIPGKLSDLFESAVNAYIAAHAAIFSTGEECGVGEVCVSVAIKKLSIAYAVANTLSVGDLARTIGALSDHLTTHSPPPLETVRSSTKVQLQDFTRMQAEHMLDDVRVTVECLAAELELILGERMPVLAIPFDDDQLESLTVGGSQETNLWALDPSGVRVSAAGWVVEPICDYSALLQNTGDDNTFIMAVLSNFRDSLSVFSASLAEWDEHSQLFDAQSLHGAAVSMCAPRVVAAISDIIVATMGCLHNKENAVAGDIITDANATRRRADEAVIEYATGEVRDADAERRCADEAGVERAIGEVRAAVDELAHFLQEVLDGEPPLRAMIRGRDEVVSIL